VSQPASCGKDRSPLCVAPLLLTPHVYARPLGLCSPYGYGLPDLALEEMCLVLHKDTLMVATSLGDDTARYIPDAAWTEVPFKRG
jgi:hypothetical protein